MELIHNQLFKVLENDPAAQTLPGVYRVILTEKGMGKVIAVHLDPPRSVQAKDTLHPRARSEKVRRHPEPPLVGALVWLDLSELERLRKAHLLHPVEVERDSACYMELLNKRRQREYEKRISTMAGFLDFRQLEEGILTHGGLGGLVQTAMAATGASRSYVYKQWSKLARFGLDPLSLFPRQDLCGGKGKPRPFEPGVRRKPGPKTLEEQIAAKQGAPIDPPQPGMSQEWQDRMLAADRQIKSPAISLRARYESIIGTAWVLKYRYVGGKLEPIKLKRGEYPNFPQFKWLMRARKTELERLQERTTKGHFQRSKRGLKGRSWEGIPGPGHTWAIDATIGDIYLRSSANRAWVIGRPVLYIIVDVWSTAIVGFYVCLEGPSWPMAKLSIFNAVAAPELLGGLWGYQPLTSLVPHPTLCYSLQCDRGEHLSIAARQTMFLLKVCGRYTPPYRPDLKGLVEVQHRIVKDQQFGFIPGAVDFRRAEMELRKVRMEDSAFTVPEYVEYLHGVFHRYNLTADRSDRLDAHMIAEGVVPSPAGLWRYGHEIGLGYSRATQSSDLIQTLLPQATATVRTNGVYLGGKAYEMPKLPGQDWSLKARNGSHWKIPVRYYPGSVSRIWTPHPEGKGFLELGISDLSRASPELTFDEVADAFAYQKLSRAKRDHERLLIQLESRFEAMRIRNSAVAATKEALDRAKGKAPSAAIARDVEKSMARFSQVADASAAPLGAERSDEDEYFEIMNGVLEAANGDE